MLLLYHVLITSYSIDNKLVIVVTIIYIFDLQASIPLIIELSCDEQLVFGAHRLGQRHLHEVIGNTHTQLAAEVRFAQPYILVDHIRATDLTFSILGWTSTDLLAASQDTSCHQKLASDGSMTMTIVSDKRSATISIVLRVGSENPSLVGRVETTGRWWKLVLAGLAVQDMDIFCKLELRSHQEGHDSWTVQPISG